MDAILTDWVERHFEQSDKPFPFTSYFLKHTAERDLNSYILRQKLEAAFERLGFRVAEEIVGAKYYFCNLRKGQEL